MGWGAENRKHRYTAVRDKTDLAGGSQRQSQGPGLVSRETLVLMRSSKHTRLV